MKVVFRGDTGLFCVLIGLFRGETGLFCVLIGLFCVLIGLFCVFIGLFCLLRRLFCVFSASRSPAHSPGNSAAHTNKVLVMFK